MIIFLNGTSSSGKSVIAREIMHQSERPFLYYSIDHLVNFWIDEKFVAFEDEPKSWFFQQHVVNVIETQPSNVQGPDVDQLRWDMIEAFTVLIKKGYDLIIDEVLLKREIFEHYAHALCQTQKVYLVKIICDLIEAERREKLRSDRYLGLTRTLYDKVYLTPPDYDFEVNTSTTSIVESAHSILSFINNNDSPKAFLAYLHQSLRFEPLKREHFPLMQMWLNTSHVNQWWPHSKEWTLNDVEEKYSTYVEGYKLEQEKKKSIRGYIIYCALAPIGYIQFYSAHDFEREGYKLENMPPLLAGVDLFIGDASYLRKGLGVTTLVRFIQEMVWKHFDYCLVDVDVNNKVAIKTYQKAGFGFVKELTQPAVLIMLKKKE